jgi:alpha-amylase
MSDHINLILALHNHQPVGNFESIFEKSYNEAYLPFIKVLARHPGIKVALHYSGSLLEWIKVNKPEFIEEELNPLLQRQQIELLSGGMYEPILPIIPQRDQIGQIKMHQELIVEIFGEYHLPRGFWVAERVWEPYLPTILNKMNVDYTFLDDNHFKLSGLKEEELGGHFITEDEGAIIRVFPINKKLRYLIPFASDPEEVLHYLYELKEKYNFSCAALGDDGEKFGIWPNTSKWVYTDGWLEKFFSLLEKEEIIQTIRPAEYIDTHPAWGKVYLPSASYKEMQEWSGGFFRNFLRKYYESDHLHKKMLFISNKIEDWRGDEELKRKAKKELYAAQSNCAYWHGIFGGLYLPHLRAAVHKNLLSAENIVDKNRYKKEVIWQEIEEYDYNRDRYLEIIYNSDSLNLFILPHQGGNIAELSLKKDYYLCVTDVISRYKEPYHDKVKDITTSSLQEVKSIHELSLKKEEDLKDYLIYDKDLPRFSLKDRFFKPNISPEDLYLQNFEELGDFTKGKYSWKSEIIEDTAIIRLWRKGRVENKEELNLTKELYLKPGSLAVEFHYTLKLLSKGEIDAIFAVEFNFNIDLIPKPVVYKDEVSLSFPFLPQRSAETPNSKEIIKPYVEFHFSDKASLFVYPIFSVSSSESGFERLYQGASILPFFRVNLKASHNEWKTHFKIRFAKE